MTGLWVTIAALVVVLVLGAWWKFNNGRMRAVSKSGGAGVSVSTGVPGSAPSSASLGNEELRSFVASAQGGGLGQQATLVQFSTAFCQPCRATRQILAEVADMVDGVRHVEIDAESHLDLVRSLDIRRTPTVLIVDSQGEIQHRAAGQPRKADVIQALGAVIS